MARSLTMAVAGTSAVLALLMGSLSLAQDSFPSGGGMQPQPGGYPQQPGGYPQQPGGYPQQPGGYPQQPGAQQPGGMNPAAILQQLGPQLDQMAQMERQDFGVQPTAQLHTGAFHGPTPSSIPGGQVITTKGVVEMVLSQKMPYVLVDVLGGQGMLPGALPASFAAQAGSFNDQTQQQFVGMLQQRTGGRKDVPIILYCQSTQCWMSYNAALRAINAGYTNVLWYRGGIEAWQSVGLPMGGPQQQGGYGGQQQGGYGGQPQPYQPGGGPAIQPTYGQQQYQ